LHQVFRLTLATRARYPIVRLMASSVPKIEIELLPNPNMRRF
jgi:hypothetical protein